MPRIVVLDSYALNPGDLDWSPLAELGECEIHDRTPAPEILPRSKGAAILLTNKTPLRRETIFALPDLRYIGVMATGMNVVDLDAATERDVKVTNVAGYGTPSVAQGTFALLLELTNRAGLHSDAVHAGEWSRCEDFTFSKAPLGELAGRTLGIVGYGEIGRAVAAIARAFGMQICALVRNPRTLEGAEAVDSLEELARRSDVLSLHCPLTEENRGMIDARILGLMKPTAFLINTARGPLVDEAALANALNAGQIAGAGLDVLSTEPPPQGNPLLGAKNCIITPHNTWATRESRARLLERVIGNVRAFLA